MIAERQTRRVTFTTRRGAIVAFAVVYGVQGEADLIATNFRARPEAEGRTLPKADEWTREPAKVYGLGITPRGLAAIEKHSKEQSE